MPLSDGRTTEYLIDTHTHIAPGVDDGSSSMEMSLAMLRSEAKQAAKVVFLTPHSSAFGGSRTAYTQERMWKVQEAAAKEGLPIRICRGCEIYTERRQMEEILQDLKDGILPSMNGTRYVLAEFSTYRGNMDEAKYCLRRYLEEGWIPIMRAGAAAGGTGRHDGLGCASDGPPQTRAHKRRRLPKKTAAGSGVLKININTKWIFPQLYALPGIISCGLRKMRSTSSGCLPDLFTQ